MLFTDCSRTPGLKSSQNLVHMKIHHAQKETSYLTDSWTIADFGGIATKIANNLSRSASTHCRRRAALRAAWEAGARQSVCLQVRRLQVRLPQSGPEGRARVPDNLWKCRPGGGARAKFLLRRSHSVIKSLLLWPAQPAAVGPAEGINGLKFCPSWDGRRP